jgi:uncharacterized protein (TIGR02271 family)
MATPASGGVESVEPAGAEVIETNTVSSDDQDEMVVTQTIAIPQAEPVQDVAPAPAPQPVEAEPIVAERVEVEPVRAEPVETETVETQPVTTRRVEIEPTVAQPAVDEALTAQSVTVEPVIAEPIAEPTPPPVSAQPERSTTTASGTEPITVERREEELRARTVERQSGVVRVTKDVVEEERTIEAPVTHEEVHVRRVTPTTSDVDVSEAFRGGVTEVPVSEEGLVASKEVRLAEEIEIEKRAVSGTERVSDTVRKEVVDVQEVGPVEVEHVSEDPLHEIVRPDDK